MKIVNSQLPLPIAIADNARFDNFYAGSNQELLHQLKIMVMGEYKRSIYLWGGAGEGKSHLLQATCIAAQQQGLSAYYLSLSVLREYTPEILQGYEHADLICLDDVHLIAGDKVWEEAIFHLYNRLFEHSSVFLSSSCNAPDQSNFKLADLISRLSWGLVYALRSMDDEERLAALILRAGQRGLELTIEAGQYLLRHHPRDLPSLFNLLDTLDHASLVAQRRLTVPFVRDVLMQHEVGDIIDE